MSLQNSFEITKSDCEKKLNIDLDEKISLRSETEPNLSSPRSKRIESRNQFSNRDENGEEFFGVERKNSPTIKRFVSAYVGSDCFKII